MAMKTLTILQFSEIFLVYILMTTLVPSLVLRAYIKGRTLSEKFLISFLVGNFGIMNLVFLLQLLHISNRYTLIAGTIFPVILLTIKINHIQIRPFFRKLVTDTKRLAEGKLGGKNLVFHIGAWIGKKVKYGAKVLGKAILIRNIEWIFLAGVLFALAWMYGKPLLVGYGYSASDTPVHLYWINGMDQNQIFIDGVYPFGYHNVIYYLHEVFQIDTYVFMRVFGFVQTIMLHMVLLVFLKLCCKSKYLCYGVVGFFVLTDILQTSTYLRFCSVLPQEYGMIFILPAAFYGFEFFRYKREEISRGRKTGDSRFCLWMFAISFSMTLAVHFYDTMIAGLFCVGIAAGYFIWFLTKKYFWKVVGTCFVSVMLAVLPMGIAFATGTPLQGSLGWGMSVINGDSANGGSGGTAEAPDGQILDDTVEYYDADGNLIETTQVERNDKPDTRPLKEKLISAWGHICEAIQNSLFSNPQSWFKFVVLGAIGLLYVLGAIFYIRKKGRLYGAMLLSVAVFMTLMSILQSAQSLGLPELMDGSRCRIYYAYMMAVLFAFAIDGVLYLGLHWRYVAPLRHLASLALTIGVVFYFWGGQNLKPEVDDTRLVTNEAITCLTNILEKEKDFNWTIVSANDEMQMAINHGYHYEVISLLREMEHRNDENESVINQDPYEDPAIKIPTPSVYVFVEKVPLDYTIGYENSGQTISEEGAKCSLPNVGGIDMYKGINRWILMSRMYFWANSFMEMHPNETSIYFENDKFVCYKIEQNAYRLFDFAIDYGYNYPVVE